jgi:hypothetical protein
MRNGGAVINMDNFSKVGIVKCTCREYIHYCNCIHACAWLKLNGVLEDYPPNMHPQPTRHDEPAPRKDVRVSAIAAGEKKRRKGGNNKRARRGGAWDKEP